MAIEEIIVNKYSYLLEAVHNYELIALADKIYGPYTRKENGRQLVIVVYNNGGRRTVSFPKYIMEQHLQRKLNPDTETIDHIDYDFNNNDLNNLRIVPRDEHSADDTRRVKNVKFKCAWCDKEFERSPRLVRDKSKKNKSGVFCSRCCAGRYSRRVQLGLIDKFPVQPYIESEYYKRIKHIKSIAFYFIKKYSSYI